MTFPNNNELPMKQRAGNRISICNLSDKSLLLFSATFFYFFLCSKAPVYPGPNHGDSLPTSVSHRVLLAPQRLLLSQSLQRMRPILTRLLLCTTAAFEQLSPSFLATSTDWF